MLTIISSRSRSASMKDTYKSTSSDLRGAEESTFTKSVSTIRCMPTRVKESSEGCVSETTSLNIHRSSTYHTSVQTCETGHVNPAAYRYHTAPTKRRKKGQQQRATLFSFRRAVHASYEG